MKRLLRKFIKNERGVAMIEFAIVTPFMFLLLFGGIEVSRYMLIVQKVEKSAYVLTDIVARFPPATVPKIPADPAAASEISVVNVNSQVFASVDRLMEPYDNPAQEMVVFSSIVHRDNAKGIANLIRWQQRSNVSTLSGAKVTSIVTGQAPQNISRQPGSVCKIAVLNGDINGLLNAAGGNGAYNNENIIVGEVFYQYKPIIQTLLEGITSVSPTYSGGIFSVAEQTIVRRIYMHPWNEYLIDLPPTTPVATSAQSKDCP